MNGFGLPDLVNAFRENPDLANENRGLLDKPAPVTAVTGSTEHDEQVAVIAWARASEVTYPELRLLHSTPNGGYRHPATAAAMKAEGQLAGWPDLELNVARHGKHALFIEMKKKGGKASPEQIRVIELLREYGNMAVICVGAEDAINTLRHYLGIAE